VHTVPLCATLETTDIVTENKSGDMCMSIYSHKNNLFIERIVSAVMIQNSIIGEAFNELIILEEMIKEIQGNNADEEKTEAAE